jgi:hypothetical protein
MHKQRIYIDTSVIGGCFDEVFAEWSNKLFDEFIAGIRIAVISDLTFDELTKAPDYIRDRINDIPIQNKEIILRNSDSNFLAMKYVEFKVISEKSFDDATHIALSTINNVDVLVSWNFKHIVNLNRILKYNSINMMFGYKTLEIRNPMEVLNDEE